MSWLFGRRKHQKDSPPDSPPDALEEQEQSNQDNDFIVVEKRQAPPPPIDGGGVPYPIGGLYPSLGRGTYPSSNPQAISSDTTTPGDATSYLSGVPFKLCKQLERNMNDDTEIDSLRVEEIVSFLGRMEQRNYEYSFTLEQGIVDEMTPREDE